MTAGVNSIGDLVKLGVAQIQTGPFGSQLHSYEYVTSGIHVVPTEAIRERRIHHDICPQITPDKASELTRHRLLAGDILFARRGVQATGHIGVVRSPEEGFVCGTGAIRLRVSKNSNAVCAEYLSHLLADPASIAWFKFHAIGATMPNLNEGIIRNFPLQLPEYHYQRAVAAFLSALDDKIELNRRVNETLEAMAQAIFRDWFVDFGPVRRKLEGANDPVAIMGGLMPDPKRASELARLFPGEFGDDELPLGWKAGDLSDLATTAGESVDPTRLTEDTPYIGLEHMPRRSITLDNWEYAGKVSSQKSRFSSGQVLFGKLRPYFHKVGIAPVDGVCSTDIVVLDSRADFDRGLVACCASSDAFVAFTDLTSSGTKMPRTSWSHMKTYGLAIADAPVRRAFSGLVGPMHQKVVSSVAENRTLAKARDYLLPRLMSGELRVGDAAQEIAA